MDFGTAEGEHTSKVPERIPADTFQQPVWQDTECSAVNRLTFDFHQAVPSFWKLKITDKEFLPYIFIYSFPFIANSYHCNYFTLQFPC